MSSPTTTSPVQVDIKQTASLLATGCFSKLRETAGKILGKDTIRLGSPYTIAIVLLVIGILGTIKVLPMGPALTMQFTGLGILIYIVATVKDQQKQIETYMNENFRTKTALQPQD